MLQTLQYIHGSQASKVLSIWKVRLWFHSTFKHSKYFKAYSFKHFFPSLPQLQPPASKWLPGTPWHKVFGNLVFLIRFLKGSWCNPLFSHTFSKFIPSLLQFSWHCWLEFLCVKSWLRCTQKKFFLTCRHQDFSQCIYLTLDPISAGLPRYYQCFQLLLHDHRGRTKRCINLHSHVALKDHKHTTHTWALPVWNGKADSRRWIAENDLPVFHAWHSFKELLCQHLQ